MSSKNGHVTTLMPMTYAAKVLGLKFDTLMAAARSGRLRVTNGSRKPAGRFVQPLVSVAQLRRYALWQAAEWKKSGQSVLVAAARRIEKAKFPNEVEPLDGVMRGRPFMWGGDRIRRARPRA